MSTPGTATSGTAAPLTSGSEGSSKAPRTYSCLQCQHRKVKCDKQSPCSGCVRAGWECVSQVPAPPRRNKRLPQVEVQEGAPSLEGQKRPRVGQAQSSTGFGNVNASVQDEPQWSSSVGHESSKVLDRCVAIQQRDLFLRCSRNIQQSMDGPRK